jgi:SSS family solute:Na+ symporter
MNIYFGTMLAYMLILVVVGTIRGRAVKTQEDFAVAGRTLSTFVVFATMLATWTGTGSIFGNAEKTYRTGLAAVILPIGELAGIALLTLIAGKARRLSQITVQDLLEKRYNATARVFGAITLVAAAVTIVSYQYRAAGAVLDLALPQLDVGTSVLIASVFIIVYTALAGMYSVAYTDVVMGVTMIIGMAIALPFFWSKAGGLEGISMTLPADHMVPFGPIRPLEALYLLLPPMLLSLGDANMYQRFFSARSASVARKATLWTLLGVLYIDAMIIVTAWAASAIMWQSPEIGGIEGRIIAVAARYHLPQVLGAVLLTTILAIIVSTAIGYLLVPATVIMRDIYQRFINPDASGRKIVWLSRASVCVLGITAFGISKLSNEFLSVALYAYTIYGAGITPALVAALVWKRATTPGAIASIAGGTGVTLLWKGLGLEDSTSVDSVLPAIIVSVLLLVLVSLGTKRQSREKLAPFFET